MPNKVVALVALLLVTAWLTTACTVQEQPGPQYAQQPTAQPAQPTAQPVYQTTYTNDFVGQHMLQRRQEFAADMAEASPLQRGMLSQGQTSDFQAVLAPGRCYRIIGVGGPGMQDLDLYLYDLNGAELQHDTATDNFPVLGLGSSAICPQVAGSYRVRALAYQGGGEFAVQLFGTQ